MQYLEHTALANATVADVFLKASLAKNDWVAKVHTIIAMSVAFLLLVVQSSFFYAIYGATDDAEREAFTGADLTSMFVWCFLLLLCVVIDRADFFADWNVVDVGPQMLPSLAFLCVRLLRHNHRETFRRLAFRSRA